MVLERRLGREGSRWGLEEYTDIPRLVSRRCHEVEALDDGRTRYRSRFALSGWMAPVVDALLGRRLARGFAGMSAAVAARAARLACRA